MTQKYAIGPWFVRPLNSKKNTWNKWSVETKPDGSGLVICLCRTEEEARLIAAAPDLLEALSDVLKAIKDVPAPFDSEIYNAIHGAALAIAKAEGR